MARLAMRGQRRTNRTSPLPTPNTHATARVSRCARGQGPESHGRLPMCRCARHFVPSQRGGRVPTLARLQRKGHSEGSSFSFLRLEPNLPSVLLDEAARNVESQPRPPNARPPGVIRAHETSEYPVALICWDTYSLVAYLYFYALASGVIASGDVPPLGTAAVIEGYRDVDGSTGRTVLDRVRDEVGQRLLDARRINNRDHYTISARGRTGRHARVWRHVTMSLRFASVMLVGLPHVDDQLVMRRCPLKSLRHPSGKRHEISRLGME